MEQLPVVLPTTKILNTAEQVIATPFKQDRLTFLGDLGATDKGSIFLECSAVPDALVKI